MLRSLTSTENTREVYHPDKAILKRKHCEIKMHFIPLASVSHLGTWQTMECYLFMPTIAWLYLESQDRTALAINNPGKVKITTRGLVAITLIAL